MWLGGWKRREHVARGLEEEGACGQGPGRGGSMWLGAWKRREHVARGLEEEGACG